MLKIKAFLCIFIITISFTVFSQDDNEQIKFRIGIEKNSSGKLCGNTGRHSTRAADTQFCN